MQLDHCNAGAELRRSVWIAPFPARSCADPAGSLHFRPGVAPIRPDRSISLPESTVSGSAPATGGSWDGSKRGHTRNCEPQTIDTFFATIARSTNMSVHDRQRRTGDAILDRLEQLEIPASLRSNVRTFRTAHNELILAISGFDNAKVACAEALATIKVADAALDRAVRILAARIVGAELGARSNPFARLSRHTPSQLQKLGYATEINEVRKLVGRLVQSKPPASVQKAANECLRLAGEVESAIGSLAEPQARQQRALQVRQAAGRDWQKQLRRLRLGAAMAWVNEPAVYRALFAAPRSLIGRGKKPRKRKIAMP